MFEHGAVYDVDECGGSGEGVDGVDVVCEMADEFTGVGFDGELLWFEGVVVEGGGGSVGERDDGCFALFGAIGVEVDGQEADVAGSCAYVEDLDGSAGGGCGVLVVEFVVVSDKNCVESVDLLCYKYWCVLVLVGLGVLVAVVIVVASVE